MNGRGDLEQLIKNYQLEQTGLSDFIGFEARDISASVNATATSRSGRTNNGGGGGTTSRSASGGGLGGPAGRSGAGRGQQSRAGLFSEENEGGWRGHASFLRGFLATSFFQGTTDGI